MTGKLSLIIALLLTFGAFAAPPDVFRPQADGYARVQGIVLENIKDCERDLPCHLRVRTRSEGRPLEVQVRARPPPP